MHSHMNRYHNSVFALHCKILIVYKRFTYMYLLRFKKTIMIAIHATVLCGISLDSYHIVPWRVLRI